MFRETPRCVFCVSSVTDVCVKIDLWHRAAATHLVFVLYVLQVTSVNTCPTSSSEISLITRRRPTDYWLTLQIQTRTVAFGRVHGCRPHSDCWPAQEVKLPTGRKLPPLLSKHHYAAEGISHGHSKAAVWKLKSVLIKPRVTTSVEISDLFHL